MRRIPTKGKEWAEETVAFFMKTTTGYPGTAEEATTRETSVGCRASDARRMTYSSAT